MLLQNGMSATMSNRILIRLSQKLQPVAASESIYVIVVVENVEDYGCSADKSSSQMTMK